MYALHCMPLYPVALCNQQEALTTKAKRCARPWSTRRRVGHPKTPDFLLKVQVFER
jgi:hypothetical protein